MQNLKSEITNLSRAWSKDPKSLYLVTGGAGFIGSNIVERLVQQGERACPESSRRVRALDNFATGKRENLAPWLERVELIEEDVVRLPVLPAG